MGRPPPALTSPVRDVLAVEGHALPLVQKQRVLQQVQRGERVAAQSGEDEVEEAAHPFQPPHDQNPSNVTSQTPVRSGKDTTGKPGADTGPPRESSTTVASNSRLSHRGRIGSERSTEHSPSSACVHVRVLPEE